MKLQMDSPLSYPYRQSWPTRVDMHQDIEDSLAASSISHAGGPQSPARSAENLLNGHRSKGMMELGRREETTVTDSQGPPAQVHSLSSPFSGVWLCLVQFVSRMAEVYSCMILSSAS